MTRRDFLAASSAALLTPMGMAAPIPDILSPASNQPYADNSLIDWSYGMRPLFCIAYIDPGIKSQQGQERSVAKYPLALVPQDDRPHFRAWRKKVRQYNPNIKLLAYQMVIEETTVPGPGHDVYRNLKNVWVKYPGGYVPTVTYTTNVGARKKIFDPRNEMWREGFLKACEAVMNSDEYDGLFLDQCTVYQKAALTVDVRDQMLASLNHALNDLRVRMPRKILIGNSSSSFPALNGEMNESRPSNLAKETSVDLQRRVPRLELFHYYHKQDYSESEIEAMFKLAISNRAFFGCSISAQSVRWLNYFDRILRDYRITQV